MKYIDIIMLIDYSRDMSMDQIQLSHMSGKQIFDRMNELDRIGFVVFNDIVHQSFPL